MWTGPGNDEHNVAMQTIGAAEHHVLVKGGDAPRYAAKPGLLLYAHLGELFAVPWRPSQTDLGRAVPVAMPERTSDGGGNEGSGNYAVSGDGTLAYVAGGRTRNATRLVWIDRAGKLEPRAAAGARLRERDCSRPTAHGRSCRSGKARPTLWIYDLARNTLTPIGNSAGSSQSPVWTRRRHARHLPRDAQGFSQSLLAAGRRLR